jgi:ADP-heptose:LPS heptosyltransferase
MSAIQAEHPVLLFANGGIGDHILTYPALAALAAAFSGRATLVTQTRASVLLYDGLGLRAVHGVRTKPLPVERLAATLPPCDVLVSLEMWNRPAARELAERLAPRTTVGLFDWCDRHVPFDSTKHSADLAFDIARAVDPGARFDHYARAFAPLRAGRRMAADIAALVPPGVRLLAVHTDTKPEKQWPARSFVRALQRFLATAPEYLAVVVGYGHELAVEEPPLGERLIDACGLPLDRTLPLVGACDLFLGIDSSMLHAADFQGVPGVGVFGPTAPREWGFRIAAHEHFHGDPIETVEPEAVADALLRLHREVVDV